MKILLIGNAKSRLCDPSVPVNSPFDTIVHVNYVYPGFRKDILSKTYLFKPVMDKHLIDEFDNFAEIWLALPPSDKLHKMDELEKHKVTTNQNIVVIPDPSKFKSFYADLKMKAIPTTGFITLMYLASIKQEVWMTGFNFYEDEMDKFDGYNGWHDPDEERAYVRKWIKGKSVNLSLNGGIF